MYVATCTHDAIAMYISNIVITMVMQIMFFLGFTKGDIFKTDALLLTFYLLVPVFMYYSYCI